MKYIKITTSSGYEHTIRLDIIKYARQVHHNQVRLMMGSDHNQQDEVVIQVANTGSGEGELYDLKDAFVEEFIRIISGRSTITDLNLKQPDGTPYTIQSVAIG